MISHTDHNNKASLLYAPSNGAQGQWIERMTSYNEDNYAVSHQYEFSCEYAEQMKIRMTLYIVDNQRVLFLQCELSYDLEGHMNRRSSWDTDHNDKVSLRCDCSCEPLNYGTL